MLSTLQHFIWRPKQVVNCKCIMTDNKNIVSNLEEVIKKVTSKEFNKKKFHCLSTLIPKKCLEEPCILGVDEAGRGPVLGPMVYAICYCPLSEVETLKTIGCTDSKALTEKKREDIFALINNCNDDLGWAVDIISPNYISNKMQQRMKYSLNEIAQSSTIKLIENLLEKNVQIKEIYVDTIGPPEKYQAKLSKLFPECKIAVDKKADSLYPIVGAASICAKVIRDNVIQNWQFPESINVEDHDFGTGYPGDPKSKEFLRESKDEIFGFPNLVRFSWSTAAKAMEDCAAVEWEDETEETESEQKDISSFFKTLSPPGMEKHTPKSTFFKERSLFNAQCF